MIDRRAFLASLGAAAARGAERPNIVFILADDLGYGDLGCYGATRIATPHADRLAAEGVRFTDAHSASAVCTPTRYGILTGRYAWRTRLKSGVLYGYSEPLIESGRMTLASLLKSHGYRTGCLGKWHLGLDWARRDAAQPPGEANIDFSQPFHRGPMAYGFDFYYGISASLDMPPYVFLENDRTVGRPSAWMEKQGIVRAGVREPDFRTVDVLPRLTAKAVDFVERARQPFFLYLPLTSPHTPVVPSPEFRGRSQAGEYGDFVVQTDWSVGQVMQALERTGTARNTLLILTSDNGSTVPVMTEYRHRPNGPWRGRKSTIWDGGHRVPFLARWPGRIRAGTTSAEPLCLNDLLATAAAIVGAKLPSGAGEDSFNMLPALQGERGRQRPAIVHHSIDGMFAIRDWPWKLVEGRGSGGWEGKGSPNDPPGQLYNLEKDPGETENLWKREPAVVERLTASLDRYRPRERP